MSKVELVRSYPYKIRVYQVGSTGKISLHHIFNLLQDVAHRDAMSFGFGFPQMLKFDRLWVLSRMSLELDALPSYDDEVDIHTWVSSVAGSKSEREFAIVFNGKRIIKATSLWYCLSSKDHRPASIPMEESLVELINNEHVVPGGAKRIESFGSETNWKNKTTLRTRNSDVDMVDHVNNASYVRWVMDEARTVYPKRLVSKFSINYLKQVRLGERVEVRHVEGADGQMFQEVMMVDSGKIACKTSTVWKNK